VHGGSYERGIESDTLEAARLAGAGPTIEWPFYGFRVASVAVPVPGDVNNDGVVDARDYIVLRKDNHPLGDYTAWRAAFGNPPGSGASMETTVPEPTSILLLLGGLVGSISTAHRR
jgi:hypothetical protein